MASVFVFVLSNESKMVILTAIAREVLVSAGSRLAGSLLSARRKCPPETGVWAVADPTTPADSSAPRHTAAITVRRFHVDVFMADLRAPPASFRCLPRTGPLHLSPPRQRSRMERGYGYGSPRPHRSAVCSRLIRSRSHGRPGPTPPRWPLDRCHPVRQQLPSGLPGPRAYGPH